MRSPHQPDSERRRDAERKKRTRAAARDVLVPPCANRRRRQRLEKDLIAWMLWYFAGVFTHGITPQQRQMALAILRAAQYGGDQAIAAPRTEGKTTVAECVALYCVLTGLLSFPVLFGATGADAERVLANIKRQLEDNDLLAADYPEVCTPIRALEGLPNRAAGQTVSGGRGRNYYHRHRTRMRWSGREIVLPSVPGSRSAGAVLATRGLDSAVRGIRVGSRRPDLGIIDDPDTRDTASSEQQSEKLAKKIDQDIAGLGGQRRRLARVMLTTIMSLKSVSALFTDPAQKPSWHGLRMKLVESYPDRKDLWEEYITLRRSEQVAGDPEARKAHALYLAHRAEMDRGGVVHNAFRFDPTRLPDGTEKESSTLEHCHNLIADLGQEAFDSEYQNQPPPESGPQESGITAYRIQTQVSGFARHELPPLQIAAVTEGIDVGKYLLHWTAIAWRVAGGRLLAGYVIDYGVQEVHGTQRGTDEAVDKGIVRALYMLRDSRQQNPWRLANGETRATDLTLVDSRYRGPAVQHFCREAGLGYKPTLGFGQSCGAVRSQFSLPPKNTADRKPGDQWFLVRKGRGLWQVNVNADHWKRWVHDRFMTPPAQPGCLLVFGQPSDRLDRLSEDQKGHFGYAKHLTNEVEYEEFTRGKLVRGWKVKSDTNHWLDATSLACVAASMLGVPTAGVAAPERPTDAPPPIAARPRRRARPAISYF